VAQSNQSGSKQSGGKPSGGKTIRVTLMKSRFGRSKGHAECAAGLGLRNRHQTVDVMDTPENRGMIRKIGYMLRIEEA
jgi:large subunit ribosomal protein L30